MDENGRQRLIDRRLLPEAASQRRDEPRCPLGNKALAPIMIKRPSLGLTETRSVARASRYPSRRCCGAAFPRPGHFGGPHPLQRTGPEGHQRPQTVQPVGSMDYCRNPSCQWAGRHHVNRTHRENVSPVPWTGRFEDVQFCQSSAHDSSRTGREDFDKRCFAYRRRACGGRSATKADAERHHSIAARAVTVGAQVPTSPRVEPFPQRDGLARFHAIATRCGAAG